jgi:hypothetical protein
LKPRGEAGAAARAHKHELFPERRAKLRRVRDHYQRLQHGLRLVEEYDAELDAGLELRGGRQQAHLGHL